jgi:hypothetical protein
VIRRRRGGPPIPQKAAAATYVRFDLNRRHGSVRLPRFDCGCADPWTCRCREPEPSQRRVQGYVAAIQHLNEHGLTAAALLPELRMLWQQGEHRLVDKVAREWELAQ